MTSFSARKTGTLYIVATPIGNLEDISSRAIHILNSVDKIIAEDTRHSLHLVKKLGVKTPMFSLHAHNENTKSLSVIEELKQGLDFALISDAGTPLISDPGFPLVKMAHENDIPVVPIPGANACITALSAAGVPCDRFTFCGFLAAKQVARREQLRELLNQKHTLVVYESTHRIMETIDDIEYIFGLNTAMVLAKELTKTFEFFVRGNPKTIKDWLSQDKNHSKGEFVLIISPEKPKQDNATLKNTLSILLQELPLKQAVNLASRINQSPKNEVYELALQLQKQGKFE